MQNRFFLFLCFFFSGFHLGAQDPAAQKLDGVVAVVGSSPILKSEVESKQVQAKLDSVPFDRCRALEDILFQKLLLTQAILDSVEVTPEQVEDELERRLRYYIAQFGSVKAFEDFYGKTIDRFKEEFREELKEVMLVQRMQARITENVTVSPTEIREFFQSIHPDSIPFINAGVEVGHIVRKPVISAELKQYSKDKLEGIRKEIIAGTKDFATAAILYSQDPGSASKGGLYKNVQRGTFVSEFDAVAFRMKEGEISELFETEYGYHILVVDARRGEEIDVRHILIVPQPSPEDMLKARTFLDSIADLIRKDSLSISEAASRFSEDEETRSNGGLIANPYTGSTYFEMSDLSQIDPNMAFDIEKLKTGQPSAAKLTQMRDGKPAYHVLFVKTRTEPHRANLKDDYQRIQEEALARKRFRVMSEWIRKKSAVTFIRIDGDYKNCKFEHTWTQPG